MTQETNWSAFVDEHGGLQEAANAAGISYDAMRLRRSKQRRAAARGELGYGLGLPGMEIKTISAKKDKVWVKETRSTGDAFELPKGTVLSGNNAYLINGADDTVIAKWVRTEKDRNIAAFTVEAIKEALSSIVPRLPIARPPICVGDLLTDYIVGDHHLGLLAWKPETGEDYDLKIGERLLVDKMDELVERTPHSFTALFTNLGDFFHSNSAKNETAKGTAVDMDGRYGKVLMVGLRLAVVCIERLLAKHEYVKVCWLRGNHDPEVAMGALVALTFKFENNPRVEIGFNPGKFFVHQHGKTMLFKTHGDQLKPNAAALFAASEYPEIWGATRKRYAHFGHVHHSAKGGTAGRMIWESFETLAAKDAWHSGEGYQADRSMTAITYHNVTGEWSRNRVSVA